MVLDVTGLSLAPSNPFGTTLKNIHFTVRAGEILGLGGVAGNGQDELLAALSGEALTAADAIKVKGAGIGHLGPNARRARGILAAPEERLGHAAAPDMSLTENALLTGGIRENLTNNGFVNWSGATDFAKKIIEKFDVRTPGTHVAARALSGGNLQKFVIGREVLQRPEVLVVNQPTWGVDAAAAAAIRQALLDLAAGGAAILVISQDLDELMEISDRFGALNEGRLSDIRPTAGLTIEEIGLMMGGRPWDGSCPSGHGHTRRSQRMIALEKRPTPSRTLSLATPLIAVVITMIMGGVLFAVLGKNPFEAIRTIFWDPVFGEFAFYYRPQLLVKAAPLVLIAIGLSLGFKAGIWNIGAEGQYIIGALTGAAFGLAFYPTENVLIFPAMVLAGALGGWAWGMIPALLKVRFGTNEILVSLMLVYVADQLLASMSLGLLRNPEGMGFPGSRNFGDYPAASSWINEAAGLHWGMAFAFIAVIFAYVLLNRHILGFNIRLTGEAPRAARFAGVNPSRLILFCLGTSGALAGMAGLFEVSGPSGQVNIDFASGYGFTAIIVAFLGRLHPVGILLAALLMALTYVGGDLAQGNLGLPSAAIQVFQGMLLFFLLALDLLTNYRVVLKTKGAA